MKFYHLFPDCLLTFLKIAEIIKKARILFIRIDIQWQIIAD